MNINWFKSKQEQGCSLDGVWWLHLDTANSFYGISSSCESDVSRFSPGWSPWVLNSPEIFVFSVVMSISNNEDTMIKAGSTGGVVEDSALVELEDGLIGFNGNWNWLNGYGGLESIVTVGGNISPWGNFNSNFGCVIEASSSNSGVAVSGFLFHSVGVSVVKSRVHKSTIAAKVSVTF